MLKRLLSSAKRPYIPGINSPEDITIDLSGNALSLKLLRNHDYEGFEERIAPILKPNIYDKQTYQRDPYGPFSYTTLFSRKWELYGPYWRVRPIGSIRATGTLLRAENLPEDMSCMVPNHFEQVVIRYLFNNGPERPQFGVRVAPVNWKIFNSHDTPWIYCEEHDKNSGDEIAWTGFSFAPVDYNIFLMLGFDCVNSEKKEREAVNEHFRSIAYLVSSTLNLRYSTEIQAKLQRLNGSTKESKYSKHREPESWVYPWAWHRGSAEHGEPPIVVTDSGTPAPEYTK